MKDRRAFTLLKLFGCCIVTLAVFTIGYTELPILINYSLLGDSSFYSGLITNMYSSVIDFFIFSIILHIFIGRHDKNDKIQLYKDNIDDCRFWYSEQAAFKNAGNIRRLQNLGINSLDLSKSSLVNTKLKGIVLKNSKLMGSCLDNTNFDYSEFNETNFQGVSANRASINNANINYCKLKYLDFQQSQMMNCTVKNCDFTKGNLTGSTFRATVFKDCCFEDASLVDSNFERADLRQTTGLTATQLLQCANIRYAKLAPTLKKEIDAIDPKLLNK